MNGNSKAELSIYTGDINSLREIKYWSGTRIPAIPGIKSEFGRPRRSQTIAVRLPHPLESWFESNEDSNDSRGADIAAA